jgi:hypothetical protein
MHTHMVPFKFRLFTCLLGTSVLPSLVLTSPNFLPQERAMLFGHSGRDHQWFLNDRYVVFITPLPLFTHNLWKVWRPLLAHGNTRQAFVLGSLVQKLYISKLCIYIVALWLWLHIIMPSKSSTFSFSSNACLDFLALLCFTIRLARGHLQFEYSIGLIWLGSVGAHHSQQPSVWSIKNPQKFRSYTSQVWWTLNIVVDVSACSFTGLNKELAGLSHRQLVQLPKML